MDKLISPFATEQQRMSEQIYARGDSSELNDWRCSARIPQSVALSIYQRNLHVGVEQHLQTHFPICYAYIGAQAYQLICAKYLEASPPEQAIFTIYAAHFPAFLLEYGEQNPQQTIWSVAAQLAQIDFFHHNTFCENQRIEVGENYYQLWISLKHIVDGDRDEGSPQNNEPSHDELYYDGLYQQLELHPERIHKQSSQPITLVTFWESDELFFRIE